MMTQGRSNGGIRIAGNTTIPCLEAIAAKGYTITHYFFGKSSNDYDSPQWEATKGEREFSATTIPELLGLIAMWEVRGDDWMLKPGETSLYDQLVESARIYDEDGNVLDS